MWGAGLLMSLGKEIVSKIIGVAGIKAASLALAFLSSVLLARGLGPEGFGAYSFVMSLLGLFALVAYSGLPNLIAREAAKLYPGKEYSSLRGLISSGTVFVGIASVVIVLGIFLFSMLVDSGDRSGRWELLLIGLPIIPLLAMVNIKVAVLRGIKRIRRAAVADTIVRPTIFIAGIFIYGVYGDLTPESALLIQIGACFAALIFSVIFVRHFLGEDARHATAEYHTSEWLAAVPPFAGIALAGFANIELINIILGVFESDRELGLYRTVVSLAMLVLVPLTIVDFVVAPYITQLYSENETVKLERLVRLASLGAFTVSAGLVLLSVFVGEWIILTVYGEDYADAFWPFLIIAVGYALVSLVGLSMQLLYATAFHQEAFKLSIYGAVLTIAIAIVLIPKLGAVGAAVALGGGKFLRSVIYALAARRHLGIKTSLIW